MARIERVEVFMVDLVPKVKRTDAIQSFTSQETPFVRIFADDGAVGTGYSYTIGTGGHAVIELLARNLAPQTDRPRSRPDRGDLEGAVLPHPRDRGRRDHLAGARRDRHRAVGHALPPLRQAAPHRGGRRAGLGPLYTTEGGWLHIETEALVEDALAAKAKGFGGSKIKVGRPPMDDAKRLEAVRNAVGDDFEIMVDGNQGAQVDEAIRRARLYEPFDLAWYEEPLPAEDLGGHVRLSASTSLPIAVGESIYSLQHFREYLQRDAASVVQVDVARIGGITPWLKVAHLAESFNMAVCPHFLMELHVALTAAVPNGRWVEYIPQLDSLTTEGMRIVDGRAVPSSEPGLGIAWDWEAIDRQRVEGCTRIVRSRLGRWRGALTRRRRRRRRRSTR